MAELVANRYAQALFEVAFENQNYELVRDELEAVVATLKEHGQFDELLKSPLVPLEEKKEILSAVFGGRVSSEVFNFLLVLLDRRRQDHIVEIFNVYKVLAARAKNKVEAIAITAVPMEQNDLLQLQVKLSMTSGKNVELKNEVDPSIIGGVLIQMEDKVIDGTIKSRLGQLKEQLSQMII